MMNPCFRLPFLLAAILSAGAGSVCAYAAEELPGGSSVQFRSRMMEWGHGDEAAPAAGMPQSAPRPPDRVVIPRLSSAFGARRDPLDGRTRRHSGVDMPAPRGSPVLAAAPGAVRRAASAGGYGQMVEIDHGYGLRTRYAHLSRMLVSPGERVETGQVIALVGSTGRSTGNHLHFEVRQNGMAVDPIGFLGGRAWAPAPLPQPAPLAAAHPHISAFARASLAAAGSAGDGY